MSHLTSRFTATIFLFSLFLMSSTASAFSVLSSEKIKGVITSVDADSNQITVLEEKSGNEKALTLTESSKVLYGESSADIHQLATGQQVHVKLKESRKMAAPIEGTIVSVNKRNYTAKIREAETRELLNIQFDESVEVTGLIEGGFKKLHEGQQVRLQYSE